MQGSIPSWGTKILHVVQPKKETYHAVINTSNLVNIHLKQIPSERNRKNIFFLMKRILGIYSSSFHPQPAAVLLMFIVLYITSLVLVCNWKFVPLNYFYPVPHHPPFLATTNLISFSMSLFVFEIHWTYNTTLVPIIQCSGSVLNVHHNRSS